MRLICPNCDAQYEVPDEVVPTDGRDVQCSNCGQTWFQHHPDHMPQEEDSGIDGVDIDAPAPDEEVSPPPPPPLPRQQEPVRKQLDPAVADILRQEAEAEHEARQKRQSEPLESQPDLGLDSHDDSDDAPDRRAREAQKRMARMRGESEPVSDAAVNAAAISSRRDLLPDIEEINSTLRTGKNRTGGTASDNSPHIEAPTTKKRKRGFRNGFLTMVVLFAALAALYIYAPQIAKAVPQVDPYLSAYVTWVDQTRLWLDGHIQNLLAGLDTMATKSNG